MKQYAIRSNPSQIVEAVRPGSITASTLEGRWDIVDGDGARRGLNVEILREGSQEGGAGENVNLQNHPYLYPSMDACSGNECGVNHFKKKVA